MVDFYSIIGEIRSKLKGIGEHGKKLNSEYESIQDTLAIMEVDLQLLEQAVKELKASPGESDRHKVIQQAKSFVALQRDDDTGYFYTKTFYTTPHFIINREKRTIVCLLIAPGLDRKKVIGRGKAKCDPDDVFNVHIGKAIAFGRAQGILVPERFLNAPRPEHAEVGDIVKTNTGLFSKRLIKRLPDHDSERFGRAFETSPFHSWLGEKQFKIIDDSKEEGGEE